MSEVGNQALQGFGFQEVRIVAEEVDDVRSASGGNRVELHAEHDLFPVPRSVQERQVLPRRDRDRRSIGVSSRIAAVTIAPANAQTAQMMAELLVSRTARRPYMTSTSSSSVGGSSAYVAHSSLVDPTASRAIQASQLDKPLPHFLHSRRFSYVQRLFRPPGRPAVERS